MDWLIILGKEKQLDIFQVPVPEKQILSIIYNFLNQIQSSSDFRTIWTNDCNAQFARWTGLLQNTLHIEQA